MWAPLMGLPSCRVCTPCLVSWWSVPWSIISLHPPSRGTLVAFVRLQSPLPGTYPFCGSRGLQGPVPLSVNFLGLGQVPLHRPLPPSVLYLRPTSLPSFYYFSSFFMK